jgi:alkyl hydroperoxide reductase subunit F
MKLYDLIIIGGGPAGAAAAVYAARKQLSTAIITTEFGGQSVVSETIYNWIGTPEIAGVDLAKNLKTHVEYYKGEFLDIFEGHMVESITKTDLPAQAGSGFSITTNKETYTTKTILVTTGSSRRKLAITGADQFENRGVVYCASCDGPLFSGMPVAVIGGGNAGFESAAQLLAYCPTVYLINRSDTFKADQITIEKLSAHPNLKIMKNTQPLEVVGEKFVTGLKVKNPDGVEEVLNVNGIFVEVGQIPNTGYLNDLVDKNEFGNVKINPWTQVSSLPGIWAAGDCTDIYYHQNNIAAGDAVKAVEDIYMTLKTK